MIEKVFSRAAGRSGESLIETLVSLLIASLALVMLAAMLNAAAHSICESRSKMAEYYGANNDISSFLSENAGTGNAEIKVTGGSPAGTTTDDIPVSNYVNDTVSSYKVISFKKK